jgi:hypothetical protein
MNPKHQIFLSEVLRHGDANRAYKTAYPEAEGEALRTATNRLLHQPAIAKIIEDFHGSIRDCLIDDIVAHRVNRVQAIRLKRSVLRSIYTKEAETSKTISSKVFEIREITIEPTIGEILRAVQMDNALAEKEEELLGYEAPSIIRFGDQQEELEETREIVTERNKTSVDVGEDPDESGIIDPYPVNENTDNQADLNDRGSDDENVTTEQSELVSTIEKTSRNVTNRNNWDNVEAEVHETEPEEELMAV